MKVAKHITIWRIKIGLTLVDLWYHESKNNKFTSYPIANIELIKSVPYVGITLTIPVLRFDVLWITRKYR